MKSFAAAACRVVLLAGIIGLLAGCTTTPAPNVSLYGPCAPNLVNLGVKF